MSLSFTFKRLIRSWRLFIALLLGIVLAATFFAGINVGADTAAKQALDQELDKVYVDVYVNPSYDWSTGRKMGSQSSQNLTDAVEAVSSVEGVTAAEVISRCHGSAQLPGKNLTRDGFSLSAITENSRVREGWIGGAHVIEANETYVWSGSPDAGLFNVGDVISLNLSLGFIEPMVVGGETQLFFPLNLTVAGSVQLTDQALSIATGVWYGLDVFMQQNYPENVFIVSWENTFVRIIDHVYNLKADYSYVDTTINVYLDKAAIISPWDTSGSITRLRAVTAQINSAVLQYYLTAQNRLEDVLNGYQTISFGMRFTFIVAALPVFFVAWYMGSTVSDVSFNMRRREIGLLLTKGFSRRQLFWMFLFEAALIGLLAGTFGIVLSLTLSPLFVTAVGGQFSGAPVIGPDSVVLTMAFAVIITFLAAYRPARRASNMATVDALREYVYVEEVKPYRKFWPWFVFLLGSFKMAVFLLGINFSAEMMRLGLPPANILLFFLLAILVFIDGILTYIGPFLFFWGFTKLFIRGSLKFQEITARAAKFLGDLGELATKSVQRNPARAAAVAFLIAFIIGYSVQIVGTLASEQDFGIRQTYFNVGSDISVDLRSPTNASEIMESIRSNVSQVESATVEYTFYGGSGLQTNMQLRAIDPETWLKAAFYENDFFSGNPVETALQSFVSENHTVILERNYAKTLNVQVGDTITLGFGDQTRDLVIVGFYGIESVITQQFGQPYYFVQYLWSYVPEGLYRELRSFVLSSSSAKILVKLKGDADGAAVADQIRGLPEVGVDAYSVSSVAEQLVQQQSNFTVTGSLNILRLGVIFIVVAASVGTALVTFVSLGERRREASIMSVRGLSFKQLLVMLLTENLAVVVFATLLGAVVGLIVVRGTVASSNAFNIFSISPVSRRMVFPSDALLTLFISFILVFASTIIPVILMAKMYSSRLERTVREV